MQRTTMYGRVCVTSVWAALCLLAGVAVGETIEGEFDSGGVRLRYQIEGEGEPVLLIHGYSVSGDINWRFPGVISLVAQDYRVITLDNRGHGQSDKPTSPEDYGLAMVSDAVGLLDHLEIERAHVVGYSMGGMIALRMLADHPERVRSAVIAGMGWTRLDDETRERYRSSPDRDGADPALTACYRAFGDLGLTAKELDSITLPMTLVVGDEDSLYESSVKPFLQERPDVPLVLIKGATHNTALFKPEFKESIKAWLDGQSAPAAVSASEERP